MAVQRRFTIVALVTLFAAYAYDVKYNHLYFRAQLRHLLPGFLFPTVERAHLIELSVVLLLAGALALVLVLGLTRMVSRHVRPRVVDRPLLFWRVAYGAVIGLSGLRASAMCKILSIASGCARSAMWMASARPTET